MVDVPSTNWFGISTDIEVYLPKNMSYDLELETVNGLIELDGINGSFASLENVNGDIFIEDVNFSNISAETVNGIIQASLTSNEAKLKTVNGKIDLEVGNASGRYKITTVNGGVIVKLHFFNGVGYHVKASTSMGNVDIDRPDFLFEKKDRKQQEAWTEDFEVMETKVHVVAETVNGDIEVRTAREYKEKEIYERLEPYIGAWFRKNFCHFTPPQKYAIVEIVNRRNILICVPTGSGKTFAFLEIFLEVKLTDEYFHKILFFFKFYMLDSLCNCYRMGSFCL